MLVRSLEGGVSVDSDGGLVELKSIKGGQVDVVTNTGDVTGTSLQGDVRAFLLLHFHVSCSIPAVPSLKTQQCALLR